MKHYTITVNGNTYEVSVEETNGVPVGNTAPIQAAAPVSSVPIAAPTPAPVAPTPEAPAPKAGTSAVGAVQILSPMPGKIVGIKVTEGKTVKKGDVLLILEAMKMENEIVAHQDGTITSINVTVGQSVESGSLLSTMN